MALTDKNKDVFRTKVDETENLPTETEKFESETPVDAQDDSGFDGVIDLTSTQKKRFNVNRGRGDSGDDDGNQNRNDGNDSQHLYKRKAFIIAHSSFLRSFIKHCFGSCKRGPKQYAYPKGYRRQPDRLYPGYAYLTRVELCY